MATETRNPPKVRRPAARSFRSRLTPAAASAFDVLTDGLAVVVSPSGSYVRLKTEASGPTVAYMHTRSTGFMVTFVESCGIDQAPARLRKSIERGGHDTRKIMATDERRIAEARKLIEFVRDRVTAAA